MIILVIWPLRVYLCTSSFTYNKIAISEEFVAHGASVNCVSLGHKSGRVLVTGGDDKKVNLWAVGKPNCIMVSYQLCCDKFMPSDQALRIFGTHH